MTTIEVEPAAVVAAVVFYLTATPVHANEVLYCADTQVLGFLWGQNGVAQSSFNGQRFTIKVLWETDRGGHDDERKNAISLGVFAQSLSRTPRVTHFLGVEPWVFYKNTCSWAFLAAPAMGPDKSDLNIAVGYGTCTKF